jgi:NAD(P)-dependent dehydrogenase (short-subunit alcohol dehydrogenase family)
MPERDAPQGAVVVVGGTAGLGLEIVKHYAAGGADVVLTGRDRARAEAAAASVGAGARGVTFDLARPETIAPALAEVGSVSRLVLSAIERDANTVADFDIARAIHLVTLKLVGYTEVIHALRDRLGGDASIVLFGGQAKERPYPGSTTVSTVNGGVVGLINTLVVELKPARVNAIHPGIVLDSPYWEGNAAVADRVRAATPTGRGVAMADIVDATVFLLENPSVNGVNLAVDGGWLLG